MQSVHADKVVLNTKCSQVYKRRHSTVKSKFLKTCCVTYICSSIKFGIVCRNKFNVNCLIDLKTSPAKQIACWHEIKSNLNCIVYILCVMKPNEMLIWKFSDHETGGNELHLHSMNDSLKNVKHLPLFIWSNKNLTRWMTAQLFVKLLLIDLI